MNFSKTILILCMGLFASCYSPVQKPSDFDKFWQETLHELGTNINSEIIKDSIDESKKWTLYKIESFQEVDFYAWVTEPLDYKKYPVKIKFSKLGRGNENSNNIPHKLFLKEEMSLNMVVDIRGQGLSTDQIKFEGYLTKGFGDKNEYIYRGAFMDAVKAVNFIAEHPKSNGNILVTGNGQGGALSIVATALSPKVTMSIIGFPFFTDMYNYDRQKWPMKLFIHETKKLDMGFEKLHQNLSYYDMINFADKIETPLFLRTQELDTITPKEGAIKFFNRIHSNVKELHIDDCKGHGCSSKSEEANKLERAFVKKNMLKD